MKRLILIAGGLVGVVLIVLFLAVKLVLTPERVRGLLEQEASAATGAEVTTGSVRASYMPVGVIVEDLVIAVPGGEEPIVTLGKGQATLKMLPLLSKRIEVKHFRLEDLALSLESDSLGIVLPGKTAEVRAGEKGGGKPSGDGSSASAGGFAVVLAMAEIRNGSLKLFDRETGQNRWIEKLDGHTSLDIEQGGQLIRADGVADLHGVGSDELTAIGLDDGLPPLRLEYEIRLEPATDRAMVDRLELEMADLGVQLSGILEGYSDSPRGELEIKAPDLDVSDLLSLRPEGVAETWDRLEASGNVSLGGKITLRGEELPGWDVRLALDDIDIRDPNLPGALEKLRGNVAITETVAAVTDLSVSFSGSPVSLAGTVEYGMPAQAFDVEIKAPRLDLGTVAGAVSLPEGTVLSGDLSLDLRASGSMPAPERTTLIGSVSLRNGAAQLPALSVPVHSLSGDVSFTDEAMIADSIIADLGRSSVRLTARVDDPAGRRMLRFRIESKLLDLDELLAPASRDSTGITATTGPGNAPAAPIVPPVPGLRGSGVVVADTLLTGGNILAGVRMKVELRDGIANTDLTMDEGRFGETVVRDAGAEIAVSDGTATGRLRAAHASAGKLKLTGATGNLSAGDDGVIRIHDVTATAYGGLVHGMMEVRLGQDGEPSYDFDIQATDLDANRFVSEMTPAKNMLFGKLRMDSKWKARGKDPEDFTASLSAEGDASAANGELKNVGAINELASFLGLPELREQKFRTFQSDFGIADSRFTTDDLVMDGKDGRWSGSGSIGFDGSLDYELALTLSEALTEKMKAKSTLSSLFTDEKGRIVFDFKLGGTTKKPDVSYDVTKTAARSGISGLGSILEELGKNESLQKMVDDFLGTGKKGVPSIKDLFGGKKDPPDSTKN